MTCQVVLLNAWGIGLASDSAVSSGQRVSNGSEKIFPLPAPHKVAILTSANAMIMGFPWESVFSAWTETLQKPLSSVEAYWLSFESWLRNAISSPTTMTDAEFDYLERIIYSNLRSEFIDEVWHPTLKPFLENRLSTDDFEITRGNEPWDAEFKSRISALVTEECSNEVFANIAAMRERRVTHHSQATGINFGQSRVWIERYLEEYQLRLGSTFFEDLLADFPAIAGIEEQLIELMVSYLCFPDWDTSTTLCLVGFGETELLPSALQVEILGFVGGVRLGDSHTASAPISRSLHLFYGQRDALDSLVLGQDSIIMDATERQKEALSAFRMSMPESDDETIVHLKEVFDNTIAKSDLANEVLNVGKETRQKPFERALQMSPVRDLAEFASTLVGVQSARAVFSQDNPTVGGPIDVATITRHEGFNWIRHKN